MTETKGNRQSNDEERVVEIAIKRLREDGTPSSFSLNGAEMSEDDYKAFLTGINYELAAFSDGEANGIELGKMVPTYGRNK